VHEKYLMTLGNHRISGYGQSENLKKKKNSDEKITKIWI